MNNRRLKTARPEPASATIPYEGDLIGVRFSSVEDGTTGELVYADVLLGESASGPLEKFPLETTVPFSAPGVSMRVTRAPGHSAHAT